MRFSQLGFLLVGLCFFVLSATAMEVSKVKGNKVLITLDGQSTQQGDQFFVVNSDGQRRGLVTIKQIRDDKAIAILTKGQAQPGWTLEKRGKKKTASHSSDSSDGPHDKSYLGILAGYSLNNMTVNQSPGPSVSLTGNSPSFKAMFDYELFDRIWFRGTAGWQNFKTTGNSDCGTSFTSPCTTNIDYLSFDLWGRYLFAAGNWRPWLGAGFSLIFPMAKSSTALVESSISNSSILSLGGGLDVFVTDSMYIPLQVEYGFLPPSNQVSAHMISMRVGLGFAF
jgi:outer membrane protein W